MTLTLYLLECQVLGMKKVLSYYKEFPFPQPYRVKERSPKVSTNEGNESSLFTLN